MEDLGTNEEIEDNIDEALDEIEDDQELREGQLDAYSTTPQQKQESNIFNWFWKVVRLKKPFQLVKVGKLSNSEIGVHSISVRDAMNLWVLGNTFHHPTFANYFANTAKIISSTSMSRNGWLMELSISQKKVRERAKNLPKGEQSWRVFKKKGNTTQEED